MVILRKTDGIVGSVSIKDRPGVKVIGTAKLEKVGRNVIVVLDGQHTPEAVTEGFKLGDFSYGSESSTASAD
jgi:hypothetical protein